MSWFSRPPIPRSQLDRIEYALAILNHKVTTLMADTSKLSTDIDALGTLVNTTVTQLGALSSDIKALKDQIAAGASDATVQASIDALDTKVQNITSTLQAGATANPA